MIKLKTSLVQNDVDRNEPVMLESLKLSSRSLELEATFSSSQLGSGDMDK